MRVVSRALVARDLLVTAIVEIPVHPGTQRIDLSLVVRERLLVAKVERSTIPFQPIEFGEQLFQLRFLFATIGHSHRRQHS
jgi:hypothetical protein